ncbi:unnamed protein product, partial [Staurois parvus]
MLLPGPESHPLMGPCTGLPLLLSPSPHSPLPCATFRSPHTAGVFHFVIGCWQITGLPLLLPGPVICHGPPYRLLMLLARSRVSHGSLYGLPLLLSLHRPHSAHVPTFRSLTLLVCSILS